jgi:flagellar motor switch/type III secretory pathway protein FliN
MTPCDLASDIFSEFQSIPESVLAANNCLYASEAVKLGDVGNLNWNALYTDWSPSFTLGLLDRENNSLYMSLASVLGLSDEMHGPNLHLTDAELACIAQSHCGELIDALELSLGCTFDAVSLNDIGDQQLANSAASYSFFFVWTDAQGVSTYGQLTASLQFWSKTNKVPSNLNVAKRVQSACFNFRLVLGYSRFTAAELSMFQVGGWILLERHSISHDADAGVSMQGVNIDLRCTAHIDKEGKLVMQNDVTQYAAMAEDSELQASEQHSATQTDSPFIKNRLSDVSVRVQFEIGEVRVPLQELLAAKPGYVMELGQRIDQHSVSVVLDGAEIGRGRLVRVGDCLGVRLDKVYGAQE